ncbi:DUF4158 domain-containing protein [Streptomyces sp. NPDC003703]|uniref:DUF4158 domain-containing protein n=1 Tax=Streptomyces sp. NPDC003283 TaxID=3364681 RepID=UPI0036AB9484
MLGAAVQLSTLPWLGFVPDDVSSAPVAAVGRLARQLGLVVADLEGYGEREQTRTDHLREIAEYLGWKPAKVMEHQALDDFLLARAMEHDSPSLLFGLGCEYLRSAKVVRPGVVTLLEKVAAGRQAAKQETQARVGPLADGPARAGSGRAAGLRRVAALVPAALAGYWTDTGVTQQRGQGGREAEVLRCLDAHTLGLSALPRRAPPPPDPDRAPADQTVDGRGSGADGDEAEVVWRTQWVMHCRAPEEDRPSGADGRNGASTPWNSHERQDAVNDHEIS